LDSEDGGFKTPDLMVCNEDGPKLIPKLKRTDDFSTGKKEEIEGN